MIRSGMGCGLGKENLHQYDSFAFTDYPSERDTIEGTGDMSTDGTIPDLGWWHEDCSIGNAPGGGAEGGFGFCYTDAGPHGRYPVKGETVYSIVAEKVVLTVYFGYGAWFTREEAEAELAVRLMKR